MEKIEEKKRFYNIDFLKFIFCISIFLYHMPKSFWRYAPHLKDFILQFKGGFICVEFFFIIAGFFWCLNADKCKDILDFAVKKIIRMWPVICFGVIICAVLAVFKIIHFDFYANVEALLFMNGFTLNGNMEFHKGLGNLHPTWFVSILFWVLLLFQYVYNNFSKKTFNLLIAITAFILLVFRIRMCSGCVVGTSLSNVFSILSPGIIRGFYSCAIGCLIAELYKNFNPILENIKLSTKWNLILSTINCFALGVIGHNLFIEPTLKKHSTFLIICFVFVLILFAFNKDFVSKFFNQKILGVFGLFSFSIYVTHAIPLEIFKQQIFIKKHVAFLSENAETMILFYIVSVLVLGIATYLFIEKPIGNKLAIKYKELKEKVKVFN